MSHTHPTASSSHNQASNFQLIINNALDAYKKRTKNDLLAHPLITELQSCNSPSTILAVLQQQLWGIDQSQRSDERWTRWLGPTVNVLFTLSGILGEGIGMVYRNMTLSEICGLIFICQVFSPAKVIFVGVGVLLSVCRLLFTVFRELIVIPTPLRQLRMLVQAKILFSTSSSALKCFYDVSRPIYKCRQPQR